MTKVMVTSAGRRRYVLEELVRSARSTDVVIAADMNPLAPALSVPGVRAIVIEGNSLEERSRIVLQVAEQEGVDALLSLHDYEAIDLSSRTHEFESFGCRFIGPSVETSRLLLDKLALANYLHSLDPSLTPRTYHRVGTLRSVAESAPRWVIKDRWGSASSGLAFVDADRVVSWVEQLAPNKWVAQPMAEGIEYNVDIFKDTDGSVAGTSAKRKWAMRGGETDSATVLLNPPKEVLDAAIRSTANLDVSGNVDVDVILAPNGIAVVLDVNPRFGGGYAFSAKAGYRADNAVWQIARKEQVSKLAPEREITAAKYVAVSEIGEL